jgi:hypothetical protein
LKQGALASFEVHRCEGDPVIPARHLDGRHEFPEGQSIFLQDRRRAFQQSAKCCSAETIAVLNLLLQAITNTTFVKGMLCFQSLTTQSNSHFFPLGRDVESVVVLGLVHATITLSEEVVVFALEGGKLVYVLLFKF